MNRFLLTFEALRNRNFRIFFTGQAISTTGTWTQKVGQAWLVLELTESGTLLGVTLALQHIPTLVLGAWGGLVADRVDKRRLLIWTQVFAGLQALALGVLTATGLVRLWMILVLAVVLGATHVLDKPTRKAFVLEMIRPDQIMNAVTLNSVLSNSGRTVGPAVAGFLIGSIGLASSFLVNAVTYAAVVISLLLLRRDDLTPTPPTPRGPGQLREGLRYVASSPRLLGPLVLMTIAGALAYEWNVTIPLMARDALGGGPETFGVMFSAMGLGAVLGGLAIAGSMQSTMRTFIITAAAFSVVVVITSGAPNLAAMLALLLLLGATSIAFRSVGAALVQLEAKPAMQGRVMALLTIAFAGTTPIGAPLAGWVGEQFGARVALGMGGVGTALATLGTLFYLRRRLRTAPPTTGATIDAPLTAADLTSAVSSAASRAPERGPDTADDTPRKG